MSIRIDKQVRITDLSGNFLTVTLVASPEQIPPQVVALTIAIMDQRGDVEKECSIVVDIDELRKVMDEL